MCYVDMVNIIITIYQYEYLCSIHFIIRQLHWFVLDLGDRFRSRRRLFTCSGTVFIVMSFNL